jgi:hypothetical protein
MAQDNINSNEFGDWLFNGFVKKDREGDKDWKWFYLLALKKYAEVGFPLESQKTDKKYVEMLIDIIRNAIPGWNTHLLILRGKEAEQDFWQTMGSYERRLRAIGHDEKSILELLDKKLKLNYGND